MIKPGGRAIIIRVKYRPEEVGRCVTTVRLLAPYQEFVTPSGQRAANGEPNPMWYVVGRVEACASPEIAMDLLGFGLYPATHLLPLDEDDDPVEKYHEWEAGK